MLPVASRTVARRMSWRAAIAVAAGLAPAGSVPHLASAKTALPESYVRVATWPAAPLPRPAGAFTDAAGIDVGDDGTVYVADRADGVVHVLSSDGRGLRLIGTPGDELGQLDDPVDVDVDGDRLYVTDRGNRRVQVFDAATGGFLAAWRGIGRPWGIAAGGDRVYVSDPSAARILVFDRAGVLQTTWGGAGAAVSLPLATPQGLALDGDGDLYVADPGRSNGPLVEISSAGGFIRSLGAADADPGSQPIDVVVDGDTPITVAPDEITSFRRFFLTTSPVTVASLIGGRGIALGPGDGLAVTVQDGWAIASGVHFFTTRDANRPATSSVDLPVAVGALRGPRRVAATDDGGAYLADAWPRVQRWGPGGRPEAHFRADGAVDVVRAPGGDAFVVDGSAVARVTPAGRDVWRWRDRSAGTWFTAGTNVGGRLVVADAGQSRLVTFDAAAGSSGPAAQVALSGLVVDIAADGNRILLVDRTAQALRVVDLAGAEQSSWPFPGRVTRVAAAGNGSGWFVLTADGWVRKYAADGTLRAAWDGGLEGAPVDLDVNASGGVLVADGRGDRIFVYAPGPAGEPVDPPKPGDRCDLVPEKTAAPRRVAAGSPVTVTLSLEGDCPSESVDLDVMLVIDRSGSMDGPKIEAARSAAVAFTAELDFRRVQAGVVTFSGSASLAQALSNDPDAVVRAATGAQPGGGTNIADGLRAARDELTGPRARASAAKALILLTDGLPTDLAATRAEAAQTRSAGVAVYAIGLGGSVDAALLRDVAGQPDRYFGAPTESELALIFTRIARRLVAGTLLGTVDVVDVIPANMRYVVNSARPQAVWDGRALRWSLAGVPPTGLVLTYQLLPMQSGRWPTNVRADGDYVDGVGFRGRVTFPVPEVEVVGNRSVYLPILFQRECPDQRSDIVLVIDTSTSMDGSTAAGGETKLDAARRAARSFVGFLALPSDRAAVVGFNDGATLVQPLTGERAALERALDRLPRGAGTRIDRGLEAALSELTGPNRRPANLPIVVLLTDGRPSSGTEADVAARAKALRDAGAHIFAIGLGADADGGLLVGLTGDPTRYSYAPDQTALSGIYQTIAWSLPCRE